MFDISPKFLTPENVKPYEFHREHFILRLKERYNLDISNDEYDLLSSENSLFEFLYKIKFNTTLGYVIIKGIKVLCLKRNSNPAKRGYPAKKSFLITTLTDEQNRWPIPLILKKCHGVTIIEFWKRYNTYYEIIEYLSNNYTEENKKEYFVDKPFGNYSDIIYGMGYHLKKSQKKFAIFKLVNYITEEFIYTKEL